MSFTIGKIFKMTVFGESHGPVIGVTVQGIPPGTTIDRARIQEELDRRRPGQSDLTTSRDEADEFSILCGVLDGKATGAPVTMVIHNRDVDSSYYEEIKNTPRPGHSDLTARVKYHNHNDYRGGGFFSGRLTSCFVMAGAIAKQILEDKGVITMAHVVRIGNVTVKKDITDEEILENVYSNPIRCADTEVAKVMEERIREIRKSGDSLGGMIEARVLGLPPGVGEPIFDSVEGVLARYMYSIPAIKGVDFGAGMDSPGMKGSECNDAFRVEDHRVITATNNAGGILGGISNGMPVVFRVAVKPTPSISKSQQTVDLETMEPAELKVKGRHDPCIAIRAVPVVENMAAAALLDLMMLGNKI